jgi:hypothetical protein
VVQDVGGLCVLRIIEEDIALEVLGGGCTLVLVCGLRSDSCSGNVCLSCVYCLVFLT